jgi:PhoPQ-activated pathogenicity-related protein
MKHVSQIMCPPKACLACVALALVLALSGPFTLHASDLPTYVSAEDSSYKWELIDSDEKIKVPGASTRLIKMTSQTWQKIPWWHWLAVIRPTEVRHPDHALLLIVGGRNRDKIPSLPREALVLSTVANRIGAVVAVLGQTPNQPLMGGRNEDALIAHTFAKYLETGDDSWPLLLPMVKGAMRAMDTVQAVMKQEYKQSIKKFVVTGASKRGWTTWLTGAMDSRVSAIAPMVIDVLNMKEQMPHQVRCWSDYSGQIDDYTKLKLPQRLAEDSSKALLKLVDPYLFRDRLTLPKLIILGTNDAYWPVDAINLYYKDLKGTNHVHYVPNAGHGLGGSVGVAYAIGALFEATVQGQGLPPFVWETRDEKEGVSLVLKPGDGAVKVYLWQAHSDQRDFRKAKWHSTEVATQNKPNEGSGLYETTVAYPAKGFTAFYGQVTYGPSEAISTIQYKLCTTVRVLDPKKTE